MFVQVKESDLALIDKLISEDTVKIGFGRTSIPKKVYLEYTLECITNDNKKSYFWYNENENLPSSIISVFNYRLLPYWAFLNFRVFNKSGYWNAKRNGWAYFDHIIKEQEKMGRYTFIYLKSISRNKPHYRRKLNEKYEFIIDPNWDQNDNFFDRYIRTVEEVIPAGSFSKWDFYTHSLFRGKPLEEDSIITKWTCKQEYRNIDQVM